MAIAISTAAQLALIGNDPGYPGNESYYLTNNIDIQAAWTPLPNVDGIVFDGNGFTISPLTMPLFGSVYNGAVRNLTLALNIDARTGGDGYGYGNLGGVAQYAVSTAFTNITTSGGILGVYDIAGQVGDADMCTFTGCINNAAVTANEEEAGGVAGRAERSSFADCVNNAPVSALGIGDYNGFAGGIVGVFTSEYYEERTSPVPAHITGCVNNGAVAAPLYGGGIAGAIGGGSIEVGGCRNHGAVSFSTDAGTYPLIDHHFGGIAGFLVAQAPYTINVHDCSNDAPVSGSGYVGGIVGESIHAYWAEPVSPTDYAGININACVNEGAVTMTEPSGPPDPEYDFYQFAGGIAGALTYYGAIANCVNKASVYSAARPNVGGIAGLVSTGMVENCTNEGTVTGAYNVGGIAGLSDWIVNPYFDDGVPPAESNRSVLRGNVNARTAHVSALGNGAGGIAGAVANDARVLGNKSCAQVSAGGAGAGGVAGLSAHTMQAGANEITDNLVSSPSVSAATSVYRVLGMDTGAVPAALYNTRVFPVVLLTGDNTGDGGMMYAGQPVSPDDPQLGAALRNGATLVCPPGERLQDCAGCVPARAGRPGCRPIFRHRHCISLRHPCCCPKNVCLGYTGPTSNA